MAPGLRTRIAATALAVAALLPVPVVVAGTAAAAGPYESSDGQRWTDGEGPRTGIDVEDLRTGVEGFEDLWPAGTAAGAGRGHPGRTTASSIPSGPPVPSGPSASDGPSPPPMSGTPDPSPTRTGASASPSRTSDSPRPSRSPEPTSQDPDSPSASPAPSASGAAPPAASGGPPGTASPGDKGTDQAGRAVEQPYVPLTPPSSTSPEWQILKQRRPVPDAEGGSGPPSDHTGDAAVPPGPTDGVRRVLPLGAGLALTGAGLAFLGLRLRRR